MSRKKFIFRRFLPLHLAAENLLRNKLFCKRFSRNLLEFKGKDISTNVHCCNKCTSYRGTTHRIGTPFIKFWNAEDLRFLLVLRDIKFCVEFRAGLIYHHLFSAEQFCECRSLNSKIIKIHRISFHHWMSQGYSVWVQLLQNYGLTFLVISANTTISYIVGLAYFQLGDKHVNVIMSATIPNNTALIITLYDAYNRHGYDNGTINIVGPGRKNIKIVIWATYEDQLYFSSDLVHKRISYAGFTKSAVNKVAKSEFGKEANVIYSSYSAPVDISVFYYGKC